MAVGADFLVFYSAGRIVADGDADHLYDVDRQAAEQREVLGRERGLAIFPYPVFAALPYALVARLGIVWAFISVTAAMVAATIAAIWLLRPVSAVVRDHTPFVLLAILASHPFQVALFGGQTVAATLLCLSGFYAGLRKGNEVAAGIWLGLLLYKPPMAIVFLLLLVWTRRWRVLAVCSATAAGLTLAAAAIAGPQWPIDFMRLASSDYYRRNAIEVDGIRSLSLPGVAQHLLGYGNPFAALLAGVVGLALIALVASVWRGANPHGERFPVQFGAVMVVTLLVSPHALFYEAGLLVLPVIFLVDEWRTSSHRLMTAHQRGLIGLGIVGFLWPLSAFIGFEPLVFLVLAVGYLTLRRLEWAQGRWLVRVGASPLRARP